MGLRDQLLWRRDWSGRPKAWLLYAGAAAVWVVLSVLWLVAGDLILGFGYLAVALCWAGTALYVHRKARRG